MRKFSIILIALAVSLVGKAESFEQLRAKAAGKSIVLGNGCFLEGVVITDYKSRNVSENPQLEWDKVDVRQTYVTSYIQNEEGVLGFRLIFNDLYDNRLPAFTRVRIDLAGCELTGETSPERYTIYGITPDKVQILGKADMSPRKLHIADLSDNDIYTYVSLQDVEFLSKEGSYTNVREYLVQPSYINSFPKPKGTDWIDESGLHVKDNAGDAIFLPVNTTCAWRRRGERLPSGVGSINGVVVCETLRRCGNPGPYQIRISGPEAVDIPMDGSSSYDTVAEWNWDRNYYYSLKFVSGEKLWLENMQIPYEGLLPDVGEGVLGMTVPGTMGPTGEFNTRCAQDGLTMGEGNRECAALMYETKAADWLTPGAALTIETSTKGFTGKGLTLDFTWVAGMQHNMDFSYGYPGKWKVAYSVDGRNFMPVDKIFLLRPIAWSKGGSVAYDAAAGYTENTVLLPGFLLGKDKIWIRIYPASNLVTERHEDPAADIDTGRPDPEKMFKLRIGKVSLKSLR